MWLDTYVVWGLFQKLRTFWNGIWDWFLLPREFYFNEIYHDVRDCRRKSKPKLLWNPKTTRLKTLFLPEWQIAQRKRSVEEETDDGPSVRRNAAEEDDDYHLQFSHLRYLRPRTDVLRFNRAQVMEKIVKSIDLSRPAHRHGKHLDEWCVFMHILAVASDM